MSWSLLGSLYYLWNVGGGGAAEREAGGCFWCVCVWKAGSVRTYLRNDEQCLIYLMLCPTEEGARGSWESEAASLQPPRGDDGGNSLSVGTARRHGASFG